MPPIDNVLAVLVAGLFLSLTPGPSMLYVLSRSVGQSRSAGFASAFGLALGGVILAIATALGLARLFAEIPQLVIILRYAGSAYLVMLGISMIWKAQTDAQVTLEVDDVKQKSFASIVWQGILVEFLNPKTVLFFALFVPPFVDTRGGLASESDIQSQLLVLGVLVPLTAIPSDALIAYLGGRLTRSLNRKRQLRTRLGWTAGLILITIALNLHLNFI